MSSHTMLRAIVVVLFCQMNVLSQQSIDPILALQTEYRRQTDLIRNDRTLDRERFYEEWLVRLQRAVHDYPDSQYAPWAEGESLGLLNSLGRFSESVLMLEERLSMTVNEKKRLRVLYQIGSAAFSAWLVEKDEKYAHKSIDSFRQARQLQDKPSESWISSAERSALLESMAFGHHLEAANLYLEAREAFLALPPARQAKMDHPSPREEQYLQRAAVEFAKANRPEEALEAVRILEQLDRRRFSMDLHLALLLDASWAGGRETAEIYCDHVADWLERSPHDESAPGLAARTASCYRRIHDTD